MSIVNFFATLLVVVLLWSLIIRWRMKNLSCQRSFSRRTAYEGEEAELVEVVCNDGPCVFPWLRVESHIPSGLRLDKQDQIDDKETNYHSCFTIMPYQRIRRRHRVKLLNRGVYDLGNAALTVGDVLGWTRFWKSQQLTTPITVYPHVYDTDELPYPLSNTLGKLITRNRLLQDPFMVRNIRPYEPGDLIRDIHWQATARTDELLVKVHDNTSCPRLMVILNAQYADDQWDDYVPEEGKQTVEESIRLAASMCLHGLRAGLSVGFAANMPRQRQGESTVMLPNEGVAYEEVLLDAFAHLQLHCSDKFIPFLDSLQDFRDMDILVLSVYDSDSIRQAMQTLRDRGNQVTFFKLEGGAL